MPRRAERGQPRVTEGHPTGGREELLVLRVGAWPAALDVCESGLVEPSGDLQLVRQRQHEALALRAVAKGRVVEDDRVAHARRPGRGEADALEQEGGDLLGGRTSADVGGSRAGLDCLVDRSVEGVRRRLLPEGVAQQQRRRCHGRQGVGGAGPGNLRRASVHGLIHPERAVLRETRPEGSGGEKPERAADGRRLVGEDVAEQVLGDDDVEASRIGQEQVGGRVDERVLDRDPRMTDRGLVDDLTPQAAGGEDVRLVDAGEVAATTRSKRECELHDALDLRSSVAKRVDRRGDPVGFLAPLRSPEVEAAGQLADDEDVRIAADLRSQR